MRRPGGENGAEARMNLKGTPPKPHTIIARKLGLSEKQKVTLGVAGIEQLMRCQPEQRRFLLRWGTPRSRPFRAANVAPIVRPADRWRISNRREAEAVAALLEKLTGERCEVLSFGNFGNFGYKVLRDPGGKEIVV
jgi:hypothetical protein